MMKSGLTLETERLIFGTWLREDIDKAVELWGDLDVTALIGGPFTQEQIAERLMREIASEEQNGYQYWPVYEKETNSFIGCCGFRKFEHPVGDNISDSPTTSTSGFAIELGFHFKRNSWGKGYGYEAATAAVSYLQRRVSFDRNLSIFAGHHPQNIASKRLLEKIGFEFTSHLFYPPTGLLHPSYCYRPEVSKRTDTF